MMSYLWFYWHSKEKRNETETVRTSTLTWKKGGGGAFVILRTVFLPGNIIAPQLPKVLKSLSIMN